MHAPVDPLTNPNLEEGVHFRQIRYAEWRSRGLSVVDSEALSWRDWEEQVADARGPAGTARAVDG